MEKEVEVCIVCGNSELDKIKRGKGSITYCPVCKNAGGFLWMPESDADAYREEYGLTTDLTKNIKYRTINDVMNGMPQTGLGSGTTLCLMLGVLFAVLGIYYRDTAGSEIYVLWFFSVAMILLGIYTGFRK